jgi:hypothetical protein
LMTFMLSEMAFLSPQQGRPPNLNKAKNDTG